MLFQKRLSLTVPPSVPSLIHSAVHVCSNAESLCKYYTHICIASQDKSRRRMHAASSEEEEEFEDDEIRQHSKV
jgi:hypothetical protein